MLPIRESEKRRGVRGVAGVMGAAGVRLEGHGRREEARPTWSPNRPPALQCNPHPCRSSAEVDQQLRGLHSHQRRYLEQQLPRNLREGQKEVVRW